MKLKTLFIAATLSIIPFSSAFAEENVLNSGDTAWMIVSTALVMMMTPAGLALFLWWNVKVQKSSEYLCNDFCFLLPCKCNLDDVGIYDCLWAG